MITRLLDTIAANPPSEVNALIALMRLTLRDDEYRELVNRELKTFPNFQKRKPLLEAGHFSGLDLLQLLIACGSKKGSSLTVVGPLIHQLIDWNLISDAGMAFPDGLVRYRWNKEKISLFLSLKILDNVLLGSSYVAQKYRQSVPAIFVRKGEDQFTGTGFLVATMDFAPKHFIVTAKHNVDPADGYTFDGFGSQGGVNYRALATDWILHSSRDLAAMPVECSEPVVSIYPMGAARILARTITLGYPRIAHTVDTYLSAHGGELNAVVTGFDRERYLIISNSVAPGNSGGPVLDEAGLCVGMVVRELDESGVSKANAALPSDVILDFVTSAGQQSRS